MQSSLDDFMEWLRHHVVKGSLRGLFGFFIVIALVSAHAPQAQAKIKYVSVEAEGYGTRKSDAVADALLQAVSQVNGAEVAGQTMSSMKEQSVESSDGNGYLMSESFQSDIATRSQGVVKSWSISSATQNDKGMWIVNITAEIAKYEASKQLKRLRMAIVDFRVDQRASPKLGVDVSKAFTRILEDGLTQSRKFAMLDRSFLQEQSAELAKIASGGFATEELARIGNRAGTDYLIVGTVTKANTTSKKVKLKTSDREITVSTSTVAVSYRIIDAATTQLKFSAEIADTEQGIDADVLAKKLAKKSVSKILNAIFPVRVLQIDAGVATLAQGGDMLQVGQKLKLVKQGPPLIDPYTKESLGKQEIPMGVVEIIDVQAKSSTARIVKSEGDISSGALIVRPYEDAKTGNQNASVEKTTKEAKKKIKSLEEKSKDDW